MAWRHFDADIKPARAAGGDRVRENNRRAGKDVGIGRLPDRPRPQRGVDAEPRTEAVLEAGLKRPLALRLNVGATLGVVFGKRR